MASPCKPTFSFKIQLAEISKQKHVQSSLNTFNRGKQDRECNPTPTMPTAAPIKKTEISGIVERNAKL